MDFINDHGGLFALIAIVLTILFWLDGKRRTWIVDLKEKLAEPSERKDLLAHRDDPRGRAYQTALERLTGWADRFYGPRKLSLRAFDRCLNLALIYPFLAALIAWLLVNVHKPGGAELFSDNPEMINRLLQAILLVSSLGIIGVYFKEIKNGSKGISAALEWLFPAKKKSKGTLGYIILNALVLVFIIFTLVASFIIFAMIPTFIIIQVVVVTGGVMVIVAGIGSLVRGSGILGLVLVGIIGVLGSGLLENDWSAAAIWLLIFVVLPLLNAVTDTVSVAATRAFLDRAKAPQRPLAAILALLCVDLIVGALCLLGLLALLTHSLDLWQSLSPQTLPLDWRAYWAQALARPSEGIALWLMIATTLAPTALHVMLGLAAILTHDSRLRRKALGELTPDADPSPAERTWIAKGLVDAKTYGLLMAGLLMSLGFLCLRISLRELWPMVPHSLLDAIFPAATQSGTAGL